ncbi:MAG: hypothetical protein K8S87_00205 [Planctomycetes bacterium]|nr:hypothetical protein [Planctomycetota bacterium]
MKKLVLVIVLVIALFAIGFTQDIKETTTEARKDSISDADKKVLTDLIEKLKSDENDEEKTLNEVIELYKRIGNLLIDELHAQCENNEKSVKKILAKIKDFQEAECTKVLDFFNMLELTDIIDKKFVIFNTGKWHDHGYQRKKKNYKEYRFVYVLGWLIAENNKTVQIFTQNLMDMTYKVKKKLPPNWEKSKDNHPENLPLPGYYKEIDYKTFCNDFIKKDVQSYSSRFNHSSKSGLLHPVTTCLFAYWALKLNLIDIAYQMLQHAIKEQKERYKNTTTKQLIAFDLAVNIRKQAITGAYKGIPRPELLKKWEILTRLPKHKFSDEASNMVKILKKMIDEDENWKEPTEEEFKTMKPAEQAEYWLYKLRDCREVLFFNRKRANKNRKNPANELKKLDIHSIPSLIEHIYDPRPTRCYCYWRSEVKSSYRHMLYSDVCIQIFEKISGIKIWDRPTLGNSTKKDDEKTDPKEKAQAWWDNYQKKGDKKYLMEEIMKGEGNVYFYGKKYLMRYPKDAFEVIVKGIENAKNYRTRSDLVEILAKIDGEATINFLIEEAKNAKELYNRVTAASLLHKDGRKDGLEILINEMNNFTAKKGDSGAYRLLQFLCKCGEPIAIKTIRNNFDKLNFAYQSSTIKNFDKKINSKIFTKKPDESAKRIKRRKLIIEIEALLITALDYEKTRIESSVDEMPYNESLQSPRICDIAAYVLQNRHKEKYEFDASASVSKRDSQIDKIKNVWKN